jgi:hypothetical protein
MTEPLFTAALFAAGRGWSVLFCKADKTPACRHGFRDASLDPAEIARLLSEPGAALLAIATGEPSGIVAIDIDPVAFKWF